MEEELTISNDSIFDGSEIHHNDGENISMWVLKNLNELFCNLKFSKQAQ